MLRSKKISWWIGVSILLIGFSSHAQREKKKTEIISDELKLAQAEAYFVEGEKYFILEDYSKALHFFQKAVELNPDDAGAHFKVAETLSKSTTGQDLNMAVASVEVSLKLDQKNKYYYQLAAGIYANLQNFIKAASTLETMMKEIPGTEENLFDQAAYYVYANKTDEAIKTYNKAESIFGVNETSSLAKQRILLETGKVNEAIAETEKLIKAFPDETQYVMAFAEMLNQNNQRARAMQVLEQFDKENPGNGNAKMLLSAFYKEAGQQEKGNALLLAVFDDPEVEVTSKLLMIGTLTAEIQLAREKNLPNQKLEELATTLFKKLEITDSQDDNVSMVGADLFYTMKKTN